MKVLVAEDAETIREGLVDILLEEGYTVFSAANGAEALRLFTAERPHFVCLDIMMPEKSGYDVCREIRQLDSEVPIIFISAKSEEIDKVLGLELGADDYILKPFGVKEVVARIRAITRRAYKVKKEIVDEQRFFIADLSVDPTELRAYRDEECIELSLREVNILRLFSQQGGKVLSRDAILDACWGINYMPNSRTLDQTISNLRRKIELNPKEPKIIVTVHGAGYRYE